jgi:hypothetical protein
VALPQQQVNCLRHWGALYGFAGFGLGMSNVHVPPNTMVFPKVAEKDSYSCSYLKKRLMFFAGRM